VPSGFPSRSGNLQLRIVTQIDPNLDIRTLSRIA
jgi:hypothetical protein